MTIVFNVLLVLHFIGWAIVLGGWLVSLRSGQLNPAVFHGAVTALIAGAVAWLISLPGWVGYSPDPTKAATKLALTVFVVGLAWYATKGTSGRSAAEDRPVTDGMVTAEADGTAVVAADVKPARTARWAAVAMGLLTIVNIVIAVFWR